MRTRQRSVKRIRHADQSYRVTRRLLGEIKSRVFYYVHFPARGTIEDVSHDVATHVWENPEFKRLPRHDQEELRGYYRGLWDALWLHAEWRVSWRGLMLNKAESNAMIPPGDWVNVVVDGGRHYWRGTMYPFTKRKDEDKDKDKEQSA